MWNKNCGGYGAIMKKKKLNPYEKLKKALLIDHVLGLYKMARKMPLL